jgi:hypothetical protein
MEREMARMGVTEEMGQDGTLSNWVGGHAAFFR